MRGFQAEAERLVKAKHQLWSPIYSFDNAPIHDMELLEELGIDNSNRARLPARSPDMHKTIEHVFGTLEGAMQTILHEDPECNKVALYKDALEKAFFEGSVTKESVQADIRSLRETYSAIAAPEHEGGCSGGWPAAKYR